jgi:hypothetical protein
MHWLDGKVWTYQDSMRQYKASCDDTVIDFIYNKNLFPKKGNFYITITQSPIINFNQPLPSIIENGRQGGPNMLVPKFNSWRWQETNKYWQYEYIWSSSDKI